MFAIIFYAASSLGITSSSNLDVSALSSSPLVSVFGIVLLGSILISLIGLVLGIVSLFQKARARVLGILGVVLNLVFLLGICLLFVLSISMSSTL
jgi:hypothetical protein